MRKTIALLACSVILSFAFGQSKNSPKSKCGYYITGDDFKNGKLTPFEFGECERVDEYGFIRYTGPDGKKGKIMPSKFNPSYWGYLLEGDVFRLGSIYRHKEKEDKIECKNCKGRPINPDDKIVIYTTGFSSSDKSNGKSGMTLDSDTQISKGLDGNRYYLGRLEANGGSYNTKETVELLKEWFGEDYPQMADQLSEAKVGSGWTKKAQNRMQTLLDMIMEYNAKVKAEKK
jgi:hypothetical protein